MDIWSQVNVDFGGDETGNFGPRLETGISLYQCDTVATITADGDVTHDPHLVLDSVDDAIVVAADKNVTMFTEGGHELHKTLQFDNAIECAVWSVCKNFVLLGDNAGKLHFYSLHFQQVIHSEIFGDVKEFGEDCKMFQYVTFTEPDEFGASYIFAVMGYGRVYMLGSINTDNLQQDILSGNAQFPDIAVSYFDVTDVHDTLTHACLLNTIHGAKVLTSGCGDSVLAVWIQQDDNWVVEMEVGTELFFDSYGIKKTSVTTNCDYVIALNTQNQLSLWNVSLLVLLEIWPLENVKDFELLRCGDSDDRCDNILLLCDGNCYSELQICDLPTLTPTYTLRLSGFTAIGKSLPNQENLFIMEGVTDNSSGNFIDTLRLRCLSEADPNTRFSRLLNKKQFEEAESFAKLFNLDLELAHKVKCIHLLDCLSPWNIGNLVEEEIVAHNENLMTCFKLIQDDVFVVDYAVKASQPTFDQTLGLLNYARNRLDEKIKVLDVGESDEQSTAGLTKVLETLHRLATYRICFKEFSISSWERFLNVDILTEFKLTLAKGHTHIAFTIWARHQCDFKSRGSCELISEILSNIPEYLRSDVLRPWLSEDFFPFVINTVPDALGSVASWLQQKAINMEILEKVDWPDNALSFCEILQNTCSTECSSIHSMGINTPTQYVNQMIDSSSVYTRIYKKENIDSTDPLVCLHHLTLQLRNLVSLHHTYECKLTLSEYSQETTMSLAYRMLDRVFAVELVPKAIERIVRPYMKEHGLDENLTLFQYIGDLTTQHISSYGASYLGEAPWEVKAIAVIACITDPEYKCCAILDAMVRAYVPWTADMQELVNKGLQLDHPRVEEIKEKCKLIELKKMLLDYDLREYPVFAGEYTERLLHNILNQDRSTAIADGIQIVEAYDNLKEEMIYSFMITNYIENDQLYKAMALLKTRPSDEAQYYCTGVVTTAETTLNFPVGTDEEHHIKSIQNVIAAMSVLRYMLSLGVQDYYTKEYFDDKLSAFMNIHELQMQHNIFISMKEYKSVEFRKDLLMRRIVTFFHHEGTEYESIPDQIAERFLDKKHREMTWSYSVMFRLGELLLVESDELRCELALAAAKMDKIDLAVKFCSEFFDTTPSTKTAEMFYKVGLTLSNLIANGSVQPKHVHKTNKIICELAKLAVCYCDINLRSDCMVLSKNARMAYNVSLQCEEGQYGSKLTLHPDLNQPPAGRQLDPFTEWTFSTEFREDSLVMDSNDVVRLSHQYTAVCLPSTEVQQQPYVTAHVHAVDSTLSAGINIDDTDTEDGCETQTALHSVEEYITHLYKSYTALLEQFMYNNQAMLALQYTIDQSALLVKHIAILNTNSEQNNLQLNILLKKMEESVQSIYRYIEQLIIKVFSRSRIDHMYALALISCLPYSTAEGVLMKQISRSGAHYKRATNVCDVGRELAVMYNNLVGAENFKAQRLKAHWAYRLSKLKITYDENLESNTLLTTISQHRHADLQLIVDFIRDSDINMNLGLLIYFNQLMLHSYVSEDRSDDIAEVKAQNAICLHRAQCAYARIEQDEFLHDNLAQLFTQVDSYNYENLQFVLQKMNELKSSASTEKNLKLLIYLMTYKRHEKPTGYEVEQNLLSLTKEEKLYHSKSLPAMSKERLPFHLFLTGDVLNLLNLELTVDAVETLSGIAKLLDIPIDNFYITAIKNSLQKYMSALNDHNASPSNGGAKVQSASANQSWLFGDSAGRQLIAKITELTTKMNNVGLAVMCANWIVKELPKGSYKVDVAELCITLSERWLKSLTDKASEAERTKALKGFNSFTSVHRYLSAEQALHKYGVTDSKYKELISQPVSLIQKLYEHDSIQQRNRATGTLTKLPDIHSLNQELAKINNLQLSKVQHIIIDQLLEARSKSSVADMTLDATMQLDSLDTSDEDEINFFRLLYVLQYNPTESVAKLASLLFKPEEPATVDYICFVRALHCLFCLVDKSKLQTMDTIPAIDKLFEMSRVVLYLMKLDDLCISHTPQSYMKCSKQGLVRGIWSNHSHQPKAVILISHICLDYHIYDIQLWNSILSQLRAFNKMDHLRQVLIQLSGVPELWPVACIQKMWKLILLDSLNQAVLPLSEQQLENCLNTATLILRSPLLFDLDLGLFIEYFCKLELLPCSVGCAILLTSSELRDKTLQQILNTSGACIKVLSQLSEWSKAGKNVPLTKMIETTVYNHINTAMLYVEVYGSEFKNSFVSFLISSNDIDTLGVYLINKQMFPVLHQLLQAYVLVWPESKLSGAFNQQENISQMELIQLYVEMNDLVRLGVSLPTSNGDNGDSTGDTTGDVDGSQLTGQNVLYMSNSMEDSFST